MGTGRVVTTIMWIQPWRLRCSHAREAPECKRARIAPDPLHVMIYQGYFFFGAEAGMADKSELNMSTTESHDPSA